MPSQVMGLRTLQVPLEPAGAAQGCSYSPRSPMDYISHPRPPTKMLR